VVEERDYCEIAGQLESSYNRMLWTALRRKAAYLPG
jgi:hypothetical protein